MFRFPNASSFWESGGFPQPPGADCLTLHSNHRIFYVWSSPHGFLICGLAPLRGSGITMMIVPTGAVRGSCESLFSPFVLGGLGESPSRRGQILCMFESRVFIENFVCLFYWYKDLFVTFLYIYVYIYIYTYIYAATQLIKISEHIPAIEKIGDWKKLEILVQNQSFWNIVGERHTASTSQQRER